MPHNVILTASRHRGYITGKPHTEQAGKPQDREFLRKLLVDLDRKHSDLLILSMGADMCFNRQVREECEALQLPYVEVQLRFNAYFPRTMYELFYLARHAALLDLGQELHVFVGASRLTSIEDLIERGQQLGKQVTIYNEHNEVIS